MIKRVALLLVLLAGVAGATAAYLKLGPFTERAEPVAARAAKKAVYQCAMHPEIVSDQPGICPICQMKLQRVDEAAEPEHAHASDVPGHAPFTLSRERQQLIGVTRGAVETKALEVEIRAVGRVAYDPSLYQVLVEYREALRSKEQIRDSSLREAHHGADAIVRAARLKLRQQGLSEAQIKQLTAGGRDPVELLLPGDAVWVYAQVYEYEVGLVAPGQTMVITAPSQPGRKFTAKVLAVDPILDPMTRTVRVRGLVPTPDASLRPESFVDVRIHVPLGEKLAVPQDAVLDTGEHQIVFVVKGEGRFEPRSVELGREAQGHYEVLSGLAAGEEVVTSANFLIDSESRFRAALAANKSTSSTSAASAAHPH